MPVRQITPIAAEVGASPTAAVSSEGRVAQNQPGTIGASWEQDGTGRDPGTVTVSITRSDGTVVVSGAATTGSPGTERFYALTPAQTAILDRLVCTWTATSDGSIITTYVEVVGGFLFSIAAARMRTPLQDTITYSTQSLLFYRSMAEQALEDICGVAFVPRYSKHNASIRSWGTLAVPRRKVRTVRAVYTYTDLGPVAIPTLNGLRIQNGGLITLPQLWSWWSLPITVSYEHGFDSPPPRVGRAAMELMRRWLVESPWDERATGFKTRDGGEMTLLTAKVDPFDIPEVVAVANMYGSPLVA